jgi:hypothetical protein
VVTEPAIDAAAFDSKAQKYQAFEHSLDVQLQLIDAEAARVPHLFQNFL